MQGAHLHGPCRCVPAMRKTRVWLSECWLLVPFSPGWLRSAAVPFQPCHSSLLRQCCMSLTLRHSTLLNIYSYQIYLPGGVCMHGACWGIPTLPCTPARKAGFRVYACKGCSSGYAQQPRPRPPPESCSSRPAQPLPYRAEASKARSQDPDPEALLQASIPASQAMLWGCCAPSPLGDPQASGPTPPGGPWPSLLVSRPPGGTPLPTPETLGPLWPHWASAPVPSFPC